MKDISKTDSIWIMPYNPLGVAVFKFLTDLGIKCNGFFDNKGSVAEFSDQPYKIAAPLSFSAGEKVVITSSMHEQELSKQLQALGFGREHLLFAKDIVDACYLYECLKNEPLFFQETGFGRAYIFKNLTDCYKQLADKKDVLLVSGQMGLVVTRICTLRCVDCANLMPYFHSPRNCDMEMTLKSIDKLFELADFVNSVEIIGGEALVVKDLWRVVEKLGEYKGKTGAVGLVTNGTLPFPAKLLEALEAYGLYVTISDYGVHSKEKERIKTDCEKRSIPVKISHQIWYKHYVFTGEEEYTDKERDENYQKCTYICPQLADGRLSSCTFIDSGWPLGILPKDEAIHICDEGITKKDLTDLLYPGGAFEACRFCAGGPTDILAGRALQAETVLKTDQFYAGKAAREALRN